MAEISILPSETPIATHWGTGSLGSETVALECPDPNALKRAVEALSERFRKVYLDGVRGIALLMAPTRAHDRTSYDMVDLVRGLAACKSIPIEGFGGGRWESESGDRRSEPDESFYVGEVAVEYRRLRLGQDWEGAGNIRPRSRPRYAEGAWESRASSLPAEAPADGQRSPPHARPASPAAPNAGIVSGPSTSSPPRCHGPRTGLTEIPRPSGRESGAR